MVSNSLNIELEKLLETLKKMARKYAKSSDYLKLRKELPEDWPL